MNTKIRIKKSQQTDILDRIQLIKGMGDIFRYQNQRDWLISTVPIVLDVANLKKYLFSEKNYREKFRVITEMLGAKDMSTIVRRLFFLNAYYYIVGTNRFIELIKKDETKDNIDVFLKSINHNNAELIKDQQIKLVNSTQESENIFLTEEDTITVDIPIWQIAVATVEIFNAQNPDAYKMYHKEYDYIGWCINYIAENCLDTYLLDVDTVGRCTSGYRKNIKHTN